MSAFIPEDWVAMKQAFWQFVRDNVADQTVGVVWARQNHPMPEMPRVVIDHISNPVSEGRDRTKTNECAVTVDTVANSTLYRVTIGGVDHDYTSDSDATLAEIMAGIIAATDTSFLVDPSQHGDSTIILTPKDGVGSFSLAVSAELGCKVVVRSTGDRIVTFSVEVFTDPDPDEATGQDALPLVAEVRDAFDNDELFYDLQQAGWAFVSLEGDRNLDEVVNAKHLDRAGFDIRLRCRSRKTVLRDFIESADVTDLLPGA